MNWNEEAPMACDESCEIVVNGKRYAPVDEKPTGKRAVVVVDRGWIFAGDVTVLKSGYLKLTRAVWVFRWESIGFDGVLKDPKNSKVTLRRLNEPVLVPKDSEVFRVPVHSEWGL
jgi:hypothetical protein